MDTLIEWLNEELSKRDWSLRELARRADISAGNLSQVMNYQRGAGPEFCRALARALRVPPEEVFRRAGLLPERPDYDAEEQRALYLFSRLSEPMQHYILTSMEALVEEQKTSHNDRREPAAPRNKTR